MTCHTVDKDVSSFAIKKGKKTLRKEQITFKHQQRDSDCSFKESLLNTRDSWSQFSSARLTPVAKQSICVQIEVLQT